MLLEEQKILFIHIPKTAGMSIEYMFLGDDYVRLHAKGAAHNALSVYSRRLCLNEMFVFTCVRNPWDRIVSAYHHDLRMIRQQKKHARHHVCRHALIKNPMAFHEMLKAVPFHTSFHYRPSSCWIKDFSALDFVVRFERIYEDIARMAKLLNLPSKMRLPHLNASQREPYAAYYDGAARELVSQRYRDEIEYFGWRFGE